MLQVHVQCNGVSKENIYIYMLFADWEVRIVKNCDRGLERPRSQFFTIQTDPRPVNNLIIFFFAYKKLFQFL